jgi:hypothetical protein
MEGGRGAWNLISREVQFWRHRLLAALQEELFKANHLHRPNYLKSLAYWEMNITTAWLPKRGSFEFNFI